MDIVNQDPDPIDAAFPHRHNVTTWPIAKAEYDDIRLVKDCVIVARMDGAEVSSVSLHLAERCTCTKEEK